MEFGRRLLTHDHARGSDGGLIVRPRLYELAATIMFGGFRSRVFDRLVARSGATAGDQVIDIGCGTGYFARRIAPVVGDGGHVVGIDPSAPVIDYARNHAPGNCTFSVASAENLPFDDASFDLVVSSLAVHHIPTDQRQRAFGEFARVLRPDGRLFVADFRPPRGRIANRGIGIFVGHAMQHQHTDQLEELARGAGFKVRETGDQRPFFHFVLATRH